MTEKTPIEIEKVIPKNELMSKKEESVDDSVSGVTVMYVLYLMYKANVFSRDVLKRLIAEIKKQSPVNVTEWLVKESLQ